MRIVLVDPSRTMRLFVTRLLEAGGHEVSPFADGTGALACMRADPEVAALITSGEIGSGMSGLELCWETRVLAGRDRPIYVILMSSSVDRNRLGEALDSGADDFISKPPVADELYARLRAAERLGAMQRELVRLASVDPLTGLSNRRVFFERAEAARERCRDGGALTAIMFDIDHFKRVNDLYGHDVGDLAIASVAQLAAAVGELVGRLGGEEFGMLTEGQHLHDGVKLAERLRAAVAALRLTTLNGPLTLSCSFGVSEILPGESIDDLLKRADVALYAAKTGGRNRVVAADTYHASDVALAS
ncbi:MAG TPA: diguanylate cyclase [Xanthobacteraceae bacterium]|nr:diguanylate cyclase [Xanthobacteraceae bacterium]